MKKSILALGVLLGSIAYAQTSGTVGVNTSEPKTTLDVSAKRDANGNLIETGAIGLKSPNLTRQEVKDREAAYGEGHLGAIIYLSDISGGDLDGSRKNMKEEGHYIFTKDKDGAFIWERIFVAEGYENLYIVDDEIATNRVVTQGNKTLTFSTNGDGKVVFKNTAATQAAPATSLKIIDGGQGVRKALFSDESGNGTWKPFAPISKIGSIVASDEKYATTNKIFLVGNGADGSTTSITLPPGKWLVIGGTTFEVRNNNDVISRGLDAKTYHSSGYIAEFYLSDNKDSKENITDIQDDITADAIANGTKQALFSVPFYVTATTQYGFGQQVIHNKGTEDKTYYMKLYVGADTVFKSKSTITVPNMGLGANEVFIYRPFGDKVGEKILYAIKMNDID